MDDKCARELIEEDGRDESSGARGAGLTTRRQRGRTRALPFLLPPTCRTYLAHTTRSRPASLPPSTTTTSTMSGICYRQYMGESDLPHIMALVQHELSEPYVIYTYRYFLHQWYVVAHVVRSVC